jgi:hypothetical protein
MELVEKDGDTAFLLSTDEALLGRDMVLYAQMDNASFTGVQVNRKTHEGNSFGIDMLAISRRSGRSTMTASPKMGENIIPVSLVTCGGTCAKTDPKKNKF